MEVETFGQKVRRLRRERNLTQGELANRVGCAVVTLRKVEYDELRPSRQIAERLAAALALHSEAAAEFVQCARLSVPKGYSAPAPLTPPLRLDEIGLADLSGRALRGYMLGEQIGRGGFGVVYRAVQTMVERDVAIKIIHPQYANHPDFIRRFEAEAQLVARLEHPHIVPLYDYWREPNVAYLVMRFLRGGSLHLALQHSSLDPNHLLRVIEQVGSALHSAHRAGVVHRDLKPANIMLDEDWNAYLVDFGIAKDVGVGTATEQTEAGALLGSPAYLSPEQIRAEPVTPQTDIYSFGVLLYELLTGQRPFQGSTPYTLIQQHLSDPLPPLGRSRPDLPGALDAIIQRATAKVPSARYSSLPELLHHLRPSLLAMIGSVPVPQAPVTAVPPTVVLELTAADNPYKGLRAFGEADASDFFGREALVQQLLSRMAEGGDLSRFLAVIGPSGSGKSSVVRAGLVPALRRGGLPGSERWFVVDFIPGDQPWTELATALERVALTPRVEWQAELRADARGLLRVSQAILPVDPETELVLVIDQFEELFTLVTDEHERTLLLDSLLAAVLDEHSRLRVVVTIRADFLDRPLRYPDLGELFRQRAELVMPMSSDEVEQAILGPAARAGLRVEPALTHMIARDLGAGIAALPQLQFTLAELFERREGRELTLRAYQAIGGVRGALARRADEVFAALAPPLQAAARLLFLRLVTLGEGAEDTRRRVRRGEVEGVHVGAPQGGETQTLLMAVAEEFSRYRLLSLDRDPETREPTIEIAHEALIRDWPRLRDWLSASREQVQLQRRIGAAAAEWESSGRDAGFLAIGSRLAQFAAAVGASGDIALNTVERAYLLASTEAEAQQQTQRQEALQHELSQARALATEQEARAELERRRAEEQQRAGQRLRSRALILMVVSLLAIVAAGVAGLQWRRALAGEQEANAQAATAIAAQGLAATERDRTAAEARVARARELAASANSSLERDPERSILLALEAVATTSRHDSTVTAEAEDALQRAVHASRVRRTLKSDHGALYSVAYSPDGLSLAAASDGGHITTWNPSTGEVLASFFAGAHVRDVVYSPDGSSLAFPRGDGIIMRDAHSGEPIRQIRGARSTVTILTFSPDGDFIAMGTSLATLYVVRLTDDKVITRLETGSDVISSLAFSPDSRRIVVGGGDDGTASVWDVTTGVEITRVKASDFVMDVAFSPDGARFATAGFLPQPKVWDAATGEPLLVLYGHTTTVNSIAFDPGGKRIVTASYDGTARIWDASTGVNLLTLAGHTQDVWMAAFSPDGSSVATASTDESVRIWRVGDSGSNLIEAIGYSADGTRLITAGDDGVARLWDLTDGGSSQAFVGHRGPIWGVEFSPDQTRLATAGADATVKLWDLASGRLLRSYAGHADAVYDVVFSPDGRAMASGGRDSRILIWDVASGKPTRQLATESWVYRLSYSPDGRLLAAAGNDISIFDTATGVLVRQLGDHTDTVADVTFSPDGHSLATGSDDRTVRIWDVQTWQQVQLIEGLPGVVWAVNYRPDGGQLVISAGTSLSIWDTRSGDLLRVLTLAVDASAVAFRPDGKELAASAVGEPLRFILEVEELVALARERVTRSLTQEECRQFMHLGECPEGP